MPNPTFSNTPAVRIQRIIQNVQVHVPGAIDNIVQVELYNTMDEFLKESNVWQQQIPFAVIAITTTTMLPVDYSIAANSGIINRLLWVKNSNLDVLTDFTMPQPGTLEKRNAPTTADTYTANVACTIIDPTDNNNYPIIDDWIYDKYGSVFQDGTIGKLMMQPAKPYSNQQLGIYHTRRFLNGMSLARSEAARLNLYGAQKWSYPGSFAVRRRKM